MTTLSAVCRQVEFKVHDSKLSRACTRVVCWHQIHLLQVLIGCWKGRLNKAWMVYHLARTLILIWTSQTMSLSWLNAWTPHSCAGDNGKWGNFTRVRGELAEDKGPSFVHHGECATDHQSSVPTGRSSWPVLCTSALTSTRQDKVQLMSYDAVVSLVQQCRV